MQRNFIFPASLFDIINKEERVFRFLLEINHFCSVGSLLLAFGVSFVEVGGRCSNPDTKDAEEGK